MTPDQQYQIAMEALKRGPEGVLGGLTGVLALLVPFTLFAMVFGIVWLKYRHRQEQIHVQSELYKQLLEKFGSGKEFTEFLETQGGQRFLEQMWSHSAGNDRIWNTMRNGIVLSTLGLGMLGLSRWTRGVADPQMTVFGGLALALGIGFLISSAVSRRLSRERGQKADIESPRVT
jgi:hypothetical protein